MAVFKCPVCLQPLIRRADIKTCGSAACLAEWRSYSPQEKMRAQERAANPLVIGDITTLDLPVRKSEKKEEAEVSAEEFTKRILGE